MSELFDGRRYRNVAAPGGKSIWRVIWWLVFTRRVRWPEWIDDVPPSAPPPSPGPRQVAVTFINHSTFLLQFGSLNVLTDPIWSMRCSPVSWTGPKRVRRPGIDLDHLPPIDVVLVSHNHYDHMDLATLRRLEQRHSPLFVTGRGNRRFLQRRGFKRVEELGWWQTLPIPGEAAVTMTPAQHFTRRGLFDTNRTLWGGFWLRQGAFNVYFTGDSGYASHFREIRQRLGAPNVALLPIGAYEPRWFMKVNHIDPDEAVRAHVDLAVRQSFAMHHGTFQLTDEPIHEPIDKLRAALKAQDLDDDAFRVLHFGETCMVDKFENDEAVHAAMR
jgi:L-ascorbate metabolism protein UlaG (beta-lactamase superfamily)